MGWTGYFNVPIAFKIDVNSLAMIEAALRGATSAAYITIGTDILNLSVGLVLESVPIHSLMHSEGAHIKSERLFDDNYPGCCSFHDACVEGMSNAKAVADRLNILPSLLHTIPDDHLIWYIQVYYIAQLCRAIICLTSVKCIIIGGGLTKRKNIQEILNGYINIPSIIENIDEYICPSKLADIIGIQSDLDLAQNIIFKKKLNLFVFI